MFGILATVSNTSKRSTHIEIFASIVVALLLALSSRTTADATVLDDGVGNEERLIEDLVRWVRDNGGTINDNLEIRRVDPVDPTSPRGIFATESLAAGETVCDIPFDVVLKPEKTATEEGGEMWDCGTVAATINAMEGETATPYGRYLLAQPRNYLPGFWSTAGKDFLRSMLGSRLPPQGFEEMLDDDFGDFCGGDVGNPLHVHAKMMVTARADFQYMIPFYDMMNHDNGKVNVEHRFDDSQLPVEKRVEILTSRRIDAGEELYLSYNRGNICEWYLDWFGAPQIFSHYGFVESLPQRWLFDFARVKFELDWKRGDDESTGGEVEARFLVPPSRAGLSALEYELRRLREFSKTEERNITAPEQQRSVTKHEWDAAWRYYDALVAALSVATSNVDATNLRLGDDIWVAGNDWWIQEGPAEQAEEENEWYNDVEPSSIEMLNNTTTECEADALAA